MAEKFHDLVKRRLARAKISRSKHDTWIDDAYRFAFPHREGTGNRNSIYDFDELFDDSLQFAAEDAANDAVNLFCPRDRHWVEYEAIELTDPAALKTVQPDIKNRAKAVFDEINRSNFYQVAEVAFQDMMVGTISMICEQPSDLTQPVEFEAVCLPSLYLEKGPKGSPGSRYRSVKMAYENIAACWPEDGERIRYNEKLRMNVKNNGDKSGTVITAMVVVVEPNGDRFWRFGVVVDGDTIYEREIPAGPDEPWICGRWQTTDASAIGIGPIFKALTSARMADQLNYSIFKNIDRVLKPWLFYDDDGVMNFEGGLPLGAAVPRLPGSKVEIVESVGRFDIGYFERDTLEKNIKRAMYQDRPEQTGDTPPTLGQWADMKAELARRRELPGARIIKEFVIPVWSRVERLMVERGDLDPILYKDQVVKLKPKSPLLERAQEEDVSRAERLIGAAAQLFGPEAVLVMVNAQKTFENMKERVGDDVIEMNSEDEMAAAAQMFIGQGQGQ